MSAVGRAQLGFHAGWPLLRRPTIKHQYNKGNDVPFKPVPLRKTVEHQHITMAITADFPLGRPTIKHQYNKGNVDVSYKAAY
jgi:hypothetical protein